MRSARQLADTLDPDQLDPAEAPYLAARGSGAGPERRRTLMLLFGMANVVVAVFAVWFLFVRDDGGSSDDAVATEGSGQTTAAPDHESAAEDAGEGTGSGGSSDPDVVPAEVTTVASDDALGSAVSSVSPNKPTPPTEPRASDATVPTDSAATTEAPATTPRPTSAPTATAVGTTVPATAPPTTPAPTTVVPTTALPTTVATTAVPTTAASVSVPSVVGFAHSQAVSTLRGAGLAVLDCGSTCGATVSSQSPGAGASVPGGTIVTLTVSAASEVAVPSVAGQTGSQAVATLVAAGFNANCGERCADIVKGSNPGQGSLAAPGTFVSLRY